MTLAGEVACLGAALLWAVSLTIFRRAIAEHGARTINLAKCGVAAVLQGATVGAVGLAPALAAASTTSLWWLVASGVIGLVVGDTALFGAVARIGVHRALLLQTLSPVVAAVLALVWHGERPTPLDAAGSAVVLCAVALVVAPRRPRPRVVPGTTLVLDAAGPLASAATGTGLLLGAVAATCQGAGVVLAKAGMVDVPPMLASFVRLAAAAAGLVLVAAVGGRLGRLAVLARSPLALRRVVPATLLGTYLALFMMMAGVAMAPAAVAAVLLATGPVFSLVIERLVDATPITARGLAGTLLALAGVAVLAAG